MDGTDDLDILSQGQPQRPALTITTIEVDYSRTHDLGKYNSVRCGIKVWAQVAPDTDIKQAASGMRELARNHVIAEMSRVIPTLRARAEALYLGKPVVGMIDDIQTTGERFLSGGELPQELREALKDFGLNPADVIVRQEVS